MSDGTRPCVVCLVGPTASGKTALGLEVAAALDAEIVSADSRQIYRGLDIGTAKPTPAERAQVPHHGLDLVDPEASYDVARYVDVARRAIEEIRTRGRRILVVGGTGLYVRALLYGLCPAPPRVPALRAVLDAWGAREGTPALHRRLARVDPPAASRIHPQDQTRIVRALEVALASGRRLSEWQAAHRFADPLLDAVVIGLAIPPHELDVRIALRVREMLAAGWLDEVAALLARGVATDSVVWRTLGYAEMARVVRGATSVDVAVADTVLATRRFAKRQRTWFRREPGIVWHHPVAERRRIVETAVAFMRRGHIANPGVGG